MMGGGSRRVARSRLHKSSSALLDDSDQRLLPPKSIRRSRIRDYRTSISLRVFAVVATVTLLFSGFYYYFNRYGYDEEDPMEMAIRRIVTPLDAPKMMDLPQFQGEHKESLYWGTYRPHIYLGIRARTPKSLIAGLMWISKKDGQYHLRHMCQDSDGLKSYGWLEHNGRDYGRQFLVDHGLMLTTSFLKSKGADSGYGGDWAVRVNVENEKPFVDDEQSHPSHLFFYIADEEGNSLNLGNHIFNLKDNTCLAFGSRKDVGAWELHIASKDDLEIHYTGFKTSHLHNLTELLQGTLVFQARQTGLLQLPDTIEYNSNALFFQVSGKLPTKFDITFLSGVDKSNVDHRIDNLSGTFLSSQLREKGKKYEAEYIQRFNLVDKVDPDSMVVGKAALGNLMGGIGFFYGESKIALPKGLNLKDGKTFIPYWPASLYTAVPSRSFFPRGFLWDEGFHQLLVWRWDIDICLDIIGHWLDLINVDGWIPREQILGAEALSKVPEEFIPQHPSNGNPPTLFLVFRDIINGMQRNMYSDSERIKILTFLERALVRLEAWFQWFNTTQSGKEMYTYYWHGRDNITMRELNPKTLMSGLDDYPRASHPSEIERHLDLRCWMLLAADCLQSIAKVFGNKDSLEKGYDRMVEYLSNFENLNEMHLDVKSGAYFDFGNHTEKVRLKWFEVKEGNFMKRELLRKVLKSPQPSLVPHVGYLSLFPFMMGTIPSESWILEKQLELISDPSALWTEHGIRSLAKTSTLYMKRNTEHDPPYWRGPIWINMNYMTLSALHHYSQKKGPYRDRARTIYVELRNNVIRNIVRNYHETGFLWEQYDQENEGKGQRCHPFTGWTSLVVLIMSESYPNL
ncbi:Mannosyl-oligosaccharide glucosidase [Zostera marina]|uniref:Mannosyl-oligosaccharide glucosidase n=1 Tax=Zostera marina TaxID=29655 RepID=A0A0K9NPQ9_ZOSMR|nr:Mannosyl-oligosaccharide glucosidase [Zostera marina]